MSDASSLPSRLLIVGAGPVGQQLARLALEVGFGVTVIDDREELLRPEAFPPAARLVRGETETLLPLLGLTSADFVAIVSQSWPRDQRALELLAGRPLAYLGMIGCQRKLRELYPQLTARGVAAATLEQVFAPIGLYIGSRTPAEIAVSICAELIGVRSGKILPRAAT